MSVKNKVLPVTRIAQLDVVRGIAILHIVAYHLWNTFQWVYQNNGYGIAVKESSFIPKEFNHIISILASSGVFSVYVFVILSGLGLYLHNKDVISAKVFYLKRFKKLLLPFYMAILLILIAHLVTANFLVVTGSSILLHQPVHFSFNLGGLSAHTVIVASLFPWLFDFSSYYLGQLDPSLWFMPLIVELYLIYPLIILGIKKYGMRKITEAALVVSIIYLGVCNTLLHIYALHAKTLDSALANQLPTFLGSFLFGMFLTTKMTAMKSSGMKKSLLFLFISVIAFIFLFYQKSNLTWQFLSYPLEGMVTFIVFFNASMLIHKLGFLTHMLIMLARKSYTVFLVHEVYIGIWIGISEVLFKKLGVYNEGIVFIAVFVPFAIVMYIIASFAEKLDLVGFVWQKITNKFRDLKVSNS